MSEPWQIPLYKFFDMPEATRVPRGSILALRPDQLAEGVLKPYKLAQLQLLARVMGVPKSGTKTRVIKRILVASQLRAFLAPATASQIKILPTKKLKGMLKAVGLYIPQNRYGMSTSLIGWRDKCRLEGRSVLAELNHYLAVSRALREGLPVPDEVLECHPSLAAKVAHANTTSPALRS